MRLIFLRSCRIIRVPEPSILFVRPSEIWIIHKVASTDGSSSLSLTAVTENGQENRFFLFVLMNSHLKKSLPRYPLVNTVTYTRSEVVWGSNSRFHTSIDNL